MPTYVAVLVGLGFGVVALAAVICICKILDRRELARKNAYALGMAKRELECLRTGTNAFPDDCLRLLHTFLFDCGKNLADIGTSCAEIEKLARECSRHKLQTTFENLKTKRSPQQYRLDDLKGDLKALNFTFSDIGASEEIIRNLDRECRKTAAMKRLAKLRLVRKTIGELADRQVELLIEVCESGFSAAELGITDEELAE